MPGQNSNKDFPLWAAERFLSTPCVMLKGVGPKVADKLQKLGIYKIRDLLFHLPTRYEDKTRVIPFSDLKEGQIAVVQGQAALDSQPVANKKLSRFLLTGEGGCLSVIFFHLKPVQIEQIIRQKWLRCYGQVRRFGRNYGLIHPEFEILKDGYQPFPKHYTPVYPSTEGLSQKRINKLVQQALAQYLPLLAQDIIPQNICQAHQLLSFREALQIVHAPPNTIDLEVLNQRSHPAFDRLSVEEMLAYQLVLTQKRMQVAEAFAIALPSQNILLPEFIKQLPFQLTRAQEKAFKEIAQDLDTTRPMRRLLQGDVGSGKTLVAILAALLALENKKQVAFLVPTEILAQQHYRILKKWLAPLGIRLGLLTGQMASDDKKEQMLAVEQGKIQLVIGTHILLQPQFKFLDLGLVIIDEQHRFGVLQRQQLLDQENSNQKTLPHLLMMTATPIPRTLAMIFFSDLRLSIIDSMPPGRKPIQTIAVGQSKRDAVLKKITQVCEKGEQVYWVCPIIEESLSLACLGAEQTAKKLMARLSPLKVGLLHSKLPYEVKDRTMQSFERGEIDVLVSTTVVEVGVDVANATVMVIESPDRLGLAQCHQLRGRVGRGQKNSLCILHYHGPLKELAKVRIEALRKTRDGFKLAELDLTLRGPGEILGAEQSGFPQFRVVDLIRDAKWIKQIPLIRDALLGQALQYVQPLMIRWGWDGYMTITDPSTGSRGQAAGCRSTSPPS